jgi:hypothetical protein
MRKIDLLQKPDGEGPEDKTDDKSCNKGIGGTECDIPKDIESGKVLDERDKNIVEHYFSSLTAVINSSIRIPLDPLKSSRVYSSLISAR